ncbi:MULTISPECIES: hypothetical protein [unclassified Nocardia]|uniref:hypothetical protein n=1 Tax=unclassified Nocardia TaxID=2637762 RepID=UPI00278C085A|nr:MULTISPECIES: hypothetical protein [unclassified Nocardia]
MRLKRLVGRRSRAAAAPAVDPTTGQPTTGVSDDDARRASDIRALAAGLQAPGLVLPTYWC